MPSLLLEPECCHKWIVYQHWGETTRTCILCGRKEVKQSPVKTWVKDQTNDQE